MYALAEQRETLSSIRLKDGETKRMDCPFCYGKGTFTITRKDGNRVWNCYKASCTASGGQGDTRSLASLKKAVVGRSEHPQGPFNGSIRINPNPIPPIITSVDNHPEILAYLSQVNVLEAVLKDIAKVSYAPKEHRVMFWMNDGQGCVGRALDGRKPKWKCYGNTSGIYTCGSGSTAVVVEDAASACAVGVITGYTGVALLGTHLDHIQKRQLVSYERLIICLDNDASSKSIKLLRKVEGLVPSTIRFLRDDIKWMNKAQIEEILK
jgi:hypothetical protein